MGIAGDRNIDRKANKRERAKEGRSRRADAAGAVSWQRFDWAAVIALTEALSRRGGALRIGKTRDGGAWAFGVYHEDDYATEYVRASEVFHEAIHEIVTAWLPEEADAFIERYAEILGTPLKDGNAPSQR